MATRRNGSSNNGRGRGLPADPRVLKFLAELVRGQAKMAREIIEVRRVLADHGRALRTLLKIAMDSHGDVQGVK